MKSYRIFRLEHITMGITAVKSHYCFCLIAAFTILN